MPTGINFLNWYQIEKYPEKVQRLISGNVTNTRYEIKNEKLISTELPKHISLDEIDNYDGDIIDSLYKCKSDTLPDYYEDVKCDFNIILEVENFEFPKKIDYPAIQRVNFTDKVYNITNANLQHQLLDKMIFPEVMLHTRPASMSSHQMYCITRQHILNNIDNKVAVVSSNYDFCFEVEKIIPLIEPVAVSRQNFFAKTKKQREKVHYETKKNNKIKVFEMTYSPKNYNGYTPIPALYADNDNELKDKVDEWLDYIISEINKPLNYCAHCNGTGYEESVKKIKTQDKINSLNKTETEEK